MKAPPGAPARRRLWIVVLAIGLLPAIPVAAQEEQQGWTFDGITLSNDQHQFLVRLIGYGQTDVRAFPSWDVPEPLASSIRHPGNDFPRRVRIGIAARWKNLAGEVEVDPHEDKEQLKNAYGELRFGHELRLRAGNFKVPVSREWLTSASKLDFIERSIVAHNLAPSRDLGVMAHGQLRDRLLYQVGVFKGDGRVDQTRAGTTGAARVVVTPINALDIGASYSQGKVKADPESDVNPPVAHVEVEA